MSQSTRLKVETARAFRVTELPAVARARIAELEAWVAADLASGDTRLTQALRLWRDSVVGRLQPNDLRPQLARLPWIFVERRKLPSQRVQFGTGDSVHAVTRYDRKAGILQLGVELVPAQS